MIVKKITLLAIVAILTAGCSSSEIKDFVQDTKDFVNNDNGVVNDAGTVTPGSEENLTITDEIQDALDQHNDARAAVGVPVELGWSNQLAVDAKSYADTLANSGVWEHDPKNHAGYTNGPYGENLYTSTAKPTLATAVKAWVDEKVYYHYGPVGDSTTCDAGQQCGHYTQVIWENTTQVGCAMSKYKTGNFKDWYVVVCKYKTPGNYIGETPY